MLKSQFVEVRHFVTVAQLGSFTLAAQALGMTGSALSKSVARLEKQLGTKLLHRTTRRIALTNDGDSYLADCLKAMTILEEAEKRLSNHRYMISKEKYNGWPISQVNHLEPLGFDQFCILANDIQSLPHKHPMLNIEFNNKIDNTLKTSVIKLNSDS